MEFLGCGVFWCWCISDAVEFLGFFLCDAVFFGLVLFGFFRGCFCCLLSFASSYRCAFACFGCFLWLVCCSARLSCVAYFSFFKGSGLDYSCQLCFVCIIYILYIFFILFSCNCIGNCYKFIGANVVRVRF